MNQPPVLRDERTLSVENASYRWAYMILSYGLLIIVTYRGFAAQESNWDLMALVVVGSLAATLYQAAHRILSRRTLVAGALVMAASAVVAVLVVIVIAAVRG